MRTKGKAATNKGLSIVAGRALSSTVFMPPGSRRSSFGTMKSARVTFAATDKLWLSCLDMTFQYWALGFWVGLWGFGFRVVIRV